jgi:3-deoxy-D-manno-octulosonic-acid transferase
VVQRPSTLDDPPSTFFGTSPKPGYNTPGVWNLYDIAYQIGLWGASPYWLIKSSARRKVRRALTERMGDVAKRESNAPAVWIHAVSLGEMNATRALIDELKLRRPDLFFIVSTTTQTGYDRGQQLYASSPNVQLIRYPLDFSSAVNHALDMLRPSVVVLMELEIWPNFVYQCKRRNIPIMLANGRITLPSFKKYKLIKPVTKRMLRRLERVCVQDQTYAQRFAEMGARFESIQITGTMKFDTAQIAERVQGDLELAADVGLSPGNEPIWVCGSTGPGEEEMILTAYRGLLADYPNMRLVIVPRHPERFDEVAALIQRSDFNLVRRSKTSPSRGTPVAAEIAGWKDRVEARAVILGDTMGELRKFYALANVVFVGRSLVDLGPRQHGSDMIEPAALGKPIIVGTFTGNFADAMDKFRAAHAVIEASNGEALRQSIFDLLSKPTEATEMGQRAQHVVREQQGATSRHADEVLKLLRARKG